MQLAHRQQTIHNNQSTLQKQPQHNISRDAAPGSETTHLRRMVVKDHRQGSQVAEQVALTRGDGQHLPVTRPPHTLHILQPFVVS